MKEGKLEVGINVQCINDRFTKGDLPNGKMNPFPVSYLKLPKKGNVYSIRNLIITEDEIGIRLNEILNPAFYTPWGLFIEPYFSADRFQTLRRHSGSVR